MTIDMTIVIIGRRVAAGKLSKGTYRVSVILLSRAGQKNGRDIAPVFLEPFPFLPLILVLVSLRVSAVHT
jgi:hypothetical protein